MITPELREIETILDWLVEIGVDQDEAEARFKPLRAAVKSQRDSLMIEYRVEYPWGGPDTKHWQAVHHAGFGRTVQQRLVTEWEPFTV